MPELTEDKTRRMLLIVEIVAIGTAAVLILIDYKIKQDLVALFKQIETAIDNGGERFYSPDAYHANGNSPVFGSPVVGDNPTVEAPNVVFSDSQDATVQKPTSRNKATNSRAGARSKTIPDPDKPVGS